MCEIITCLQTDGENEPVDGGERESRGFSEVNPFGLPEGESEVDGGAPITSEALRPDSPQRSAVSPSRGVAPPPLQTPLGRKVATGNSAYGPLQAMLAFSEPEPRPERVTQVRHVCVKNCSIMTKILYYIKINYHNNKDETKVNTKTALETITFSRLRHRALRENSSLNKICC